MLQDVAAAEKDIVICATTSRSPLFDGRVLDEGTHLNVVGSNFLHKSELDLTTISRADVIVCDSIEQCRLEAGDFREAIAEGHTDWSLMHELSETSFKEKPSDVELPKVSPSSSPSASAIEDVALGVKLYQMAIQDGLGVQLPIG